MAIGPLAIGFLFTCGPSGFSGESGVRGVAAGQSKTAVASTASFTSIYHRWFFIWFKYQRPENSFALASTVLTLFDNMFRAQPGERSGGFC